VNFEIRQTALPGVVEIIPRKWPDARGFLSETFSAPSLARHGLTMSWVQDNHSHSVPADVLRGLHFQRPPKAQDKLMRVVRGAILDVIVDIRRGSPDYGRWIGIVISAQKWNQVLVPKGFAHGFLTLEPDTEVVYKVSEVYSAEHDGAIRYDDRDLGIDWGLNGRAPILSDKDARAPLLRDQDPGFVYEATE